MIDLHTHTILSDGVLIASELVQRAKAIGYKAIALTDHCDWSNIDFVVPHLVKAAELLSRDSGIKVLAGAEITHAPLAHIKPLVQYARDHGAKIVIVHGETVSEPVLKGTNREGIEAGATILAHPGSITKEDAAYAAEKGVYLEITTRKGHCVTNAHVVTMARAAGASLVLNTDSHHPEDLMTRDRAERVLNEAGLTKEEKRRVFGNSKRIVKCA